MLKVVSKIDITSPSALSLEWDAFARLQQKPKEGSFNDLE